MSETQSAADVRTDSKGAKVLGALKRAGVKAVRILLIPALIGWAGYLTYQDPAAVGRYLASHLGVVVWVVLVVGIVLGRFAEARARMTAILAPAKSRRRKAQTALQATPTAVSEWIETAFFRDKVPWRLMQYASTAATVWAVSTRPLSVRDFMEPPVDWAAVSFPLFAPLVWVCLLAARVRPTMKARHESIQAIYNIVYSCMKFPRPNQRPTGEQVRLLDPFKVVNVKEWETLELPRRFRVEGPKTMSVTDTKVWEELMDNLDAKLPHPEGWHLEKDRSGTSAEIYPAQYPISVLWEGQYDPDPLVYQAGVDLDAPGEWASFTFGETSPHIMVTGGTGAGKSSFAEIVLAQAAIKPMPWDQTLFADCHIIDPKGPFANRWENRPNMTVTNGAVDTVDEMGEPQSGIVSMAMHAEKILAELQRRSDLQNRYKGIATWVDLPDEVKKSEKLRPLIIVFDEFLDFVTKDSSKSEASEVENAAKDRVVYIAGQVARKGRSLGLHMILVAQDGKMTDIGSSLVRQMVARGVMGNMDRTAMGRMFGEGAELGILPASRLVNGKLKGIPGRGRLMNAPGQAIRRIQVAWFGGSTNSDALDKYLPRTAAVGEVRESVDALEDKDGNGIPDAWENLPPDGMHPISENEFDALTAIARPVSSPESPAGQEDAAEDEAVHAESAPETPTAAPKREDGQSPAQESATPPATPAVAQEAPPATPVDSIAAEEEKWLTNNPFAAAAQAKAEPPAEVQIPDDETPKLQAPPPTQLNLSDLFGTGKPRA